MRILHLLVATVVAGFATWNSAIGQGTAIAPQKSPTLETKTAARMANSGLVPGESVPNSISDSMYTIERILAAPNPGIAIQEETFGELMTRLNAIGVPVLLHDSAIDDELDGDTTVSGVGLTDLPLYWQLTFLLEKHNASLELRDGYAIAISKDSVDDPVFFVTITYDVSGLASFEGHKVLASVISQTVNPDQWTSTGTGDQTISFSLINGHTLMSISAPWGEHLNVRKFLTQLRQMSVAEMPEGSAATHSGPGQNPLASIPSVWHVPAANAPNPGGGPVKVDDR